MTRKGYVKALREIADFFEANEEVPLPDPDPLHIFVGASSKEDAARIVRGFGTCQKRLNDSVGLYYIEREFGGLTVSAVFSRNAICDRLVVGSKIIPEQIIPEQIIPAHTEDVVEWHCPDVLLEVSSENRTGKDRG